MPYSTRGSPPPPPKSFHQLLSLTLQSQFRGPDEKAADPFKVGLNYGLKTLRHSQKEGHQSPPNSSPSWKTQQLPPIPTIFPAEKLSSSSIKHQKKGMATNFSQGVWENYRAFSKQVGADSPFYQKPQQPSTKPNILR